MARATTKSKVSVGLLSFSITFIVLGLIAIFLSSAVLIHEIAAARHDSSTAGKVTSSYTYYANPDRTRRHKDCTTLATYVVEGEEYEVRSDQGLGCPFATGSKVTVHYSSSDPSDASISHGDSRGALLVFLAGLVATGFGIAGLAKMFHRSKATRADL